jgi:hypothetical protein
MDGMDIQAIHLEILDSTAACSATEMAPTGAEIPGAETPVAGLAMVEAPLWNRNDCRLVWYSVEKFRCELL